MGACVFVASGLRFDVDGYLRTSPFKPVSVFRRGEIPTKESSTRPDSGFVVLIREGSLTDQISAALMFLSRHERDFQTMRQHGVDNLLFDFGVERAGKIQESHYLPPELISRMGQLDAGEDHSQSQLSHAGNQLRWQVVGLLDLTVSFHAEVEQQIVHAVLSHRLKIGLVPGQKRHGRLHLFSHGSFTDHHNESRIGSGG